MQKDHCLGMKLSAIFQSKSEQTLAVIRLANEIFYTNYNFSIVNYTTVVTSEFFQAHDNISVL